jgi:enamine deaminase RidA (YjgF/YER057c/UK114 family)
MNGVWERWVVPGAAPARATVLSPALAGTGYKVAIGVIAARD